MPKESIVVYKYIQVEPSERGKKPLPELPPFFTDDEKFVPLKTNTEEIPEISQSACNDEYSTHTSPYFFNSAEKILRVNADSKNAHIPGKPVDWPSLLNSEAKSEAKHFVYHATLYSDQAGDLHRSEATPTRQYHDDLYYSNGYNLSLMAVRSFNDVDTTKLSEKPYLIKDEETGKYKMWGFKESRWQLTDVELTEDSLKILPENWKLNQTVFVSTTDAIFNIIKQNHTHYLPYADFTRNIQVFKPAASEKIDDIIVINDGIPYLITGVLDHFEKMVTENKLTPNTALVFVNTLPGIKKTMSPEVAAAFNNDPSVNLSGMGVRLVDYKHGIDQYTDFLADKLFPQLKNEISVPDDPNHRVMIGSSLSGTASIYIGSKRPDLFGAVIAQSPSPANREILGRIPRASPIERNIHLSCGQFEHPEFAAANDFVDYAAELAHKLGIPLRIGAHGHQFVAWNEELERSLPETMNELRARKSGDELRYAF